MDGFQTMAAIRELEGQRSRRTPIVAMTAHAMKGDRERCLEAGMDGYISKPVQSKVLYETVEALTTTSKQVLPPVQIPAPAVPVARQAVNLDEILDRLGGNAGLLQSIVALFEEDSPGQLTRIREAIQSRDAGALTVAAHTLKGSLLALAAERASAAALELEKMGRESRLQGASEWLVILESEVSAVGSDLQKILKERLSVGTRG